MIVNRNAIGLKSAEDFVASAPENIRDPIVFIRFAAMPAVPLLDVPWPCPALRDDSAGTRSPTGLALVETIAAAGHHLHHKQS